MLRTLRASTPVESFLGGGQDRGEGLVVVLKIAQVLIAERAIVRRDPQAQ